MAKYANGNRSQAISDRSGMAFPYGEMVTEWNGSFVHISEFEAKTATLYTVGEIENPSEGTSVLKTTTLVLGYCIQKRQLPCG